LSRSLFEGNLPPEANMPRAAKVQIEGASAGTEFVREQAERLASLLTLS